MRLVALIENQVIGHLAPDQHGHPRFTYAPDWQHSKNAIPLSLNLPLSKEHHPTEAVSAVLWGLLPDNEATLQRWASRFQVSPRNPLALLSHVGEDCAGAVQFVTEARLEDVLSGASDGIEPLTDGELEARLRRLRQDIGAARQVDDVGQFSLAGAQAKIALLHDGLQWAIPAGRIPTTHILKPPSGEYDGFVENELFCLCLAHSIGLPTATAQALRVGAETAICVKRYDRTRVNGVLLRIHQEDTCQALGVMPHIKYQNQGGPGVEAISQLLWTHSSQPRQDVETLFQALVFNYLIGGTDAHAKNYSLLLSQHRQVRLAPLYDISSALPYPHLQQRKIKMAMKIGSHYRWWDIRPGDWRQLAETLHLDAPACLAWMAMAASALPDQARDLAVALREDGVAHPVLDALVDAIAASCQRTRTLLQSN
ncbi:type II toxin-antitoxin system HipA family toxin [Xanthomonas oryzae]|uniref:Type II toxin-antitoxin system HipA family toxin n=1 Tax=Xanthomonas oryzae pv. leersiae TaxID=3112258 RepID=A0AAJ6GZG5_9XANT|nr:type II toxin-antitoxin system HipA family toxin [Xanthomonas oryzae]WIX06546.1 type II toxin-antitoxin system HipA family toxin [Xanthomonas oryzae pv. oryzae]QBG89822.1 type II toxin-antitoxin system HipA family toxin [Xanthomonas oryzae]QBG90676.1 type II toxin-antitoxin system HipA family toxin [Xanthomonas oryzae]QBG97624.1 type II toxin-antitoxin system HipA family toxin [Xanthomonas oryzae]QBH02475.1 type II toxin-antitoxin system HipA family toxin [Xanthomonas oryzae]